jgi:predicted nucleic-acid-binding protein
MIQNKRLEISKRLSSFKYWLYESNGLRLQQIIDNILDPLKTDISQDEIDKYMVGVSMLKSNYKITDQQYENFVTTINSRKLIYTNDKGELDPNGNWDYVNKLNTNFYDLADLLTELLIRSYNTNNIVSKSILKVILGNTSDEQCKNILLKHRHKLPQLFDSYLVSPNELLKFTKNIKVNSHYGETLENSVVNKLKDIGYKVLYQGGNGDFIDMIFSIDFIIEGKNNVLTVQSKTNEYQVEKFVSDYWKGKHNAVDLLIYPTNTKYKIFMVKDNVTKEIDK